MAFRLRENGGPERAPLGLMPLSDKVLKKEAVRWSRRSEVKATMMKSSYMTWEQQVSKTCTAKLCNACMKESCGLMLFFQKKTGAVPCGCWDQ